MNGSSNHSLSVKRLVRQQHDAIGRAIAAPERLLAMPSDGGTVPHIAAQVEQELVELRDRLRQHFRDEEEGGFLDEAAAAIPRLSAEVEQLKGEHDLLLQKLEELCADLRQCERNATGLAAVLQTYQAFRQLLLAHESRENQLLQIGYNADFDLDS